MLGRMAIWGWKPGGGRKRPWKRPVLSQNAQACVGGNARSGPDIAEDVPGNPAKQNLATARRTDRRSSGEFNRDSGWEKEESAVLGLAIPFALQSGGGLCKRSCGHNQAARGVTGGPTPPAFQTDVERSCPVRFLGVVQAAQCLKSPLSWIAVLAFFITNDCPRTFDSRCAIPSRWR